MTVEITESVAGPYETDGITDTFPFGFRVMDAAHLAVMRRDPVNEITTQVDAADYTVEGVDESAGGQAVFHVAPSAGYTLYLVRQSEPVQPLNLTRSGPWHSSTQMRAFDRATLLIQECLRDLASRVLRVPWGSPLTALEWMAMIEEIHAAYVEGAGYGVGLCQYLFDATASASDSAQGEVEITAGSVGQRILMLRTAVTSATVSGAVVLTIHSDPGRLTEVYRATIDLATQAPDSLPAFADCADPYGKLYWTLENLTAAEVTVSVDISAQAMGTREWAGEFTTVGPGLRLVGTQPTIDLTDDLQFSGNALAIRPDPSALVRPVRLAHGIGITGAVALESEQEIPGRKIFHSLAIKPGTAAGAPITGTWQRGQIYQDNAGRVYICTTTGTPGQWSHLTGCPEDIQSETAAIAATGSEDLHLTAPGNESVLLGLRIWCIEAATASWPVRLRAYETSERRGREQCGPELNALCRTTITTAPTLASGDTLYVEDNSQVEMGELIAVNTGGEAGSWRFSRVIGLTGGNITLQEPLEDPVTTGACVATVAELPDLATWNLDGDPGNFGRVWLRMLNDHASEAAQFYLRCRARAVG